MLEFMDQHEGSGEVITYLDEPLTNLLENMKLDDDTILIFMSDHGWHMHSIFFLLELEIVKTEANLPTLMFVMPFAFVNKTEN